MNVGDKVRVVTLIEDDPEHTEVFDHLIGKSGEVVFIWGPTSEYHGAYTHEVDFPEVSGISFRPEELEVLT